ncbi:unnamed protein product [Arctia plantaginis]|uniref:Uncharacterized protein n=1 Tax=Arctia plantaginis TaxID=874455 RepID=A0A8S0YM87_ARCPL|nr:unnamed protein product [Arctia plantaginis]CAB3227578.1 unnamed protein product [Arctia plantaginis]
MSRSDLRGPPPGGDTAYLTTPSRHSSERGVGAQRSVSEGEALQLRMLFSAYNILKVRSACDASSLTEPLRSTMFGSAGGVGGVSGGGGAYAGGGGDCADGYGLGYVAGGPRLQQYAAHFAPHQNVWHHHHPTHHDSYSKYIHIL